MFSAPFLLPLKPAELHSDGGLKAIRNKLSISGRLVPEYVKADILVRLIIDDKKDARFEHLRRDPNLIEELLQG